MHVFGHQEDVIVESVGDDAAVGDGGQARTLAPAEPAIDPVTMEVGGTAPDSGREAVGEHLHDLGRRRRGRVLDRARPDADTRIAPARPSPGRRPRRRSAGPAHPGVGGGSRCGRAAASVPPRECAVHSARSSRDRGNSRPLGVAAKAWPERPTRCSRAATDRGEPSWHTRSISPMSMPSSRDAVATRACSVPALSRPSASRRCSHARLP